MNLKKCPLKNDEYCDHNCAWWCEIANCCAILASAEFHTIKMEKMFNKENKEVSKNEKTNMDNILCLYPGNS